MFKNSPSRKDTSRCLILSKKSSFISMALYEEDALVIALDEEEAMMALDEEEALVDKD